jgi:hypothetical protein
LIAPNTSSVRTHWDCALSARRRLASNCFK